MAPIKQHHDAAARNRDKTKRRKRPSEHANHLLYRCMGDLCGEECDQELQPVPGISSQRRNDMNNKRLQQEDMEMDGIASDPDDADYVVDERERRRQAGTKAGRVNKVAAKKTPAKQIKDMPVKLGLQKAERYLCSALDFGVQAGYLTPKDTKGRVLRVASGLLQTSTVSSVKRINTDAMDARAIERRGGGGGGGGGGVGGGGGGNSSTTNPMKTRRPQVYDSQDISSQEVRDDEGGDTSVDESKRQKSHGKKSSRSRSKRHGMRKRSHAKSRSRSRSKRRHGRRRSMGRSRSLNADGEGRNKPSTGDGSEEQDDLGNENNSQETTGSSTGSRNDDDGKSVKSTKSSKSTPNNDSQTSSEDKNKHNDNDNASNDDEASDDEDDPIKK